MPFEKCPVCGGEMVAKKVEKLLRGGLNTATVTVSAEVCLRCGERTLLTGDSAHRVPPHAEDSGCLSC